MQAFPSLQAFVLGIKTQPTVGSHVSVVHTLLSLHTSASAPRHTPFAHVSPVVQALPSLQTFVLLVKTHPVSTEHESVVQGLLSLQSASDRHSANATAAFDSASLAIAAGMTAAPKHSTINAVRAIRGTLLIAIPPVHLPLGQRAESP